jgi:hypothetical protein
MLTVILYGKNDSHGYNYHKRLAISLNCIAEMLTSTDDEIIFVDDGSPFDFPTAIEAVFDTLTEKTKKSLKVFRTRDRHSSPPREPLCRNIGIRHSNPKNRWILSTNIDMIFVPSARADSLSTIVQDLPHGFYQLPRLELPENFWEQHCDRKDPQKNLTLIRKVRENLALDTIVRRPHYLTFDNPGDFQLMPRAVIFEMGGFHEGMTRGWHVDSNLAKRMSLYFKENPLSLEKKLWGYHCNHTRQMTIGHTQNASENSWETYVQQVDTPFLKEQEVTWGRASNERILLNQESLFYPYPEEKRLHDILLDKSRFNTLTYHTEIITPHLIDHFHHLPKGSKIGYIGHNSSLVTFLTTYFPIIQPSDFSFFEKFYQESTLIVFDFGFEEKEVPVSPSHPSYRKLRKKLRPIMTRFLDVIRFEKNQDRKKKLLGINVLFTDFHALFHCHLYLYKTTSFTGISMGYAKKKHPYRLKQGKKELKFLLMYLALRHFYFKADQIRTLSYKTPFIRKLVQHK